MSEDAQPRIRALLELERAEFIHNDLASAAFRLKRQVKNAVDSGDREGIGLDMMAALTMTAFAYEAYLNFVGHTAIKDWDERQALSKKERAIFGQLRIEWAKDERPYATVTELKELRNVLAHGKPSLSKLEWKAVGTHSELEDELSSYRPGWRKVVHPEFVERAFDDVDLVWKAMLKAANISVLDTMTHGSGGITFLSYADQEGAGART